MERAETMARLLDVGYRMSLFPNPKGYHNEWDSVLSAAGASQGYFQKYNEINQENVEDYLFFDEDNLFGLQLYFKSKKQRISCPNSFYT